MLKVAHVMRYYLAQSETFIWQYLHGFEHISPVVIAAFVQNPDQFPLPGGKLYPVPGSRWRWLWFIDNWYRRVLKRPFGCIKRIIRNEGIQVIHAHFGPVGCNYLPLSLSLKIPLITNFYGYDLSNKEVVAEHRAAYTQLFNEGALFLVEGPGMCEQLISIGCPEEKISIQRIAIDLEQYPFKTRSWNGERPIRLLFVGRFVEKKGLEYALRALAGIKGDYPFEFRIIGGGDLEKDLHSLAVNLGFTEEIVWFGMQPRNRVIEEIESCDILIQPSITAKNGDSEGGAPTIILEAQACGVPVISTTHADIPYITRPDKSALLSPERDTDHLADNLCYLFNNSETWAEMGMNGRRQVEEFHNIKKEAVVLEKIYENVLLLSETS